MPRKPFLDYYAEKKIIPVKQDISDIEKHFRRRAALYRALGLVPSWIKGKSVIEFGPGTGDNATFTSALKPNIYRLVDGSPTSIQALEQKVADGIIENVEIRQSGIIEYEDKQRYDLVLCEGVISDQTESAKFLSHVASFANDGGVVVTTTTDTISLLSEICRRLVKPVLKIQSANDEELFEKAVSFFTPHLKTLEGMSRYPEDWVLDVILQPLVSDDLFPFHEAINVLADDFEIHGASPQFLLDWRWYKEVDQIDTGRNALAQDRYRSLSHLFLDYRLDPATLQPRDNSRLAELCLEASKKHIAIWDDDDVGRIGEILEIVEQIAEDIDLEMPSTAKSLRSFIIGMNHMIVGKVTPDFGDFDSLFGRGTQYASFVRRESK